MFYLWFAVEVKACYMDGYMGAGNMNAESWRQARLAAEHGVDDATLMQRYPIPSRNALRQRRFREKWMTPKAIAKEVAIRRIKHSKMDVAPRNASHPDAADVITQKLLDILSNNNLRTAEMADDALRVAAKAPPEIKTWNDIMTAQKLIRLAAGADSGNEGGNAVQINFAPVFNAAGRVERVLDVEEYGDAIEA